MLWYTTTQLNTTTEQLAEQDVVIIEIECFTKLDR